MIPLADQIVQALEQEGREPYYIVGFLQAILRQIEQGHPAKETLEFHLKATRAEAAKHQEAFHRTALRLAELEVAHRQRRLQKTDRWLAGLPPHGPQEALQRVFPHTATIEEAQP